MTASFPELGGLGALFADMLLDGEVVALDGGVPSFGALAERMHVQDARRAAALSATRPVTYMVFDLLRLYGVDLTRRPLAERRATLERLDLQGAVLAGAADVRRRARAAGGDPRAGAGGRREQAARLDVPAGAAQHASG